jgi:predicted metalloprotease with PDZ domain
MMAVWSPGYYVQENYSTHIVDLSAQSPDGHALHIEETQPSHWRVTTDGAQTVVVSYTLQCDRRSVTGDWVDTTMAIINGPATYITLADHSSDRRKLNYTEALDWFGLQLAPSDDPAKAWTLEVRPDATPAQTAHLDKLTRPYGA